MAISGDHNLAVDIHQNATTTQVGPASRMKWTPGSSQIVHGDYSLGNVLVNDGRVSGVLDFEIAGIEMRLTDLVAALNQSTDDLAPDQVTHSVADTAPTCS